MFARVYPKQRPDQIVDLQDWRPHEEFDPFAPGSKPKGLHWCPESPEFAFLLPRHLYMFKTADDWRARQFWSEVIAYELSKLCALNVPPCFVARSSDGDTFGALSEIFLNYDDKSDGVRLVHGADLIRASAPSFDDKKGRPHTYRNNVRICRVHGVERASDHWAAVLAFDALIGNTDRHPENWGLLRLVDPRGNRHWMAPAYDNGTSLGYSVPEEKLDAETQAEQIDRFVARGTHHVQMRAPEVRGGGHFDVCRAFLTEFPESRGFFARTLEFEMRQVADVVDWCSDFDTTPVFSRARGNYVMRLIESRKRQLEAIARGG